MGNWFYNNAFLYCISGILVKRSTMPNLESKKRTFLLVYLHSAELCREEEIMEGAGMFFFKLYLVIRGHERKHNNNNNTQLN